MDIRVVETMMTSGSLADPAFRIDGSLENISLDWDNDDQSLAVVDTNMNYSILPWQLYDDMVKKVFLTYNGWSCDGAKLLETVVAQSADDADVNQIPGFYNSNAWVFTPGEFHYNPAILELTDISQYSQMPYDWSAGFTVVKQFLTSQANVSPNLGAYTAFYRAPQLTNFVPANVEGNKIYTDGWYTSYVCTVKKWTGIQPPVSGTGDIVWYGDRFWINLTGASGALAINPTTQTIEPDSTNWAPDPNFEQWQTLMMNNVGPAEVDDPIYFVESQHLVTVELNQAILNELKKCCECCDKPNFWESHMDTYQKLIQKRLGAWVQFNSQLFHEASCILESARPLCNLCLYHVDECNTTPRLRC